MFRAEAMIQELYRSSHTSEATPIINWNHIEKNWDNLELCNLNNQNVKRFDGFCFKVIDDKKEFDLQKKASEETIHVLKPYYYERGDLKIMGSLYLSNSKSLQSFLNDAKINNPGFIHEIMQQVENAIEKLNNIGIKHGDLQSDDNILVKDNLVYIIDFDRSEQVTKEVATDNNLVQGLFGEMDDGELRNKYNKILASTTPKEPPKVTRPGQSLARHSPSKKMRPLSLW